MNTPDFHIRPAVPADETQLGRLAGQLVRVHSAWNSRRFLTLDDVEVGYGRWLANEACNPDALVLVAERADAVVGYTYARFEARNFNALLGPHAALHDILVDESARGAGIARALLHGVRQAAIVRKLPRIVLHTAVQNEPGQKLFGQAGFATTMLEMTCELEP